MGTSAGCRSGGTLGHSCAGTGRAQSGTSGCPAGGFPAAAVCSPSCSPDLWMRSALWILFIECVSPAALGICRLINDPKEKMLSVFSSAVMKMERFSESCS